MTELLPLQDLPRRTVPDLLERSRRFGDDRLFLYDLATDTTLTYGEFLARVSGAAAYLADRIPAGSLVGVMLSNRIEYVVLRFALSCAGLVEVALNGAHKGPVLAGMLETARPAAIVVEATFMNNLRTCGYTVDNTDIISDVTLAEICSAWRPWDQRPAVDIAPGDTCRVIFTSGTTGASKGAELSHAYEVYCGQGYARRVGLGRADRWMYVTPFFHADAQFTVSVLLQTGGALVLASKFSASRFWSDAMRSGATTFLYVGTILAILLKGADAPAGHSVRSAIGGGCPEPLWRRFEARFGIPLIEVCGMTEFIGITCIDYRDRRIGSAGKPIDGYRVAIVDQFDRPLPPGERGEIIIRPTEPFAMMTGYLRNAEATLARYRNLWFHTGDLGSFDQDGFMYFHGRIKDSIRRRGENISAVELEAIADGHPAVMYAAAVGVPAKLGEEDVMLYLQSKPGMTIDPADVCRHIADNAAPFMVPSYIRVVASLPLTPTEKVIKGGLARAADADTWVRPAN